MKFKTSELAGFKLDLAVAKAEGEKAQLNYGEVVTWKYVGYEEYRLVWRPSTEWAQGGPIIEREKIAIDWDHDCWNASTDDLPAYYSAETPLIAAMRCYVASKLGDEVELTESEMEDA